MWNDLPAETKQALSFYIFKDVFTNHLSFLVILL